MDDAQPQARFEREARTAHEPNRLTVRGLLLFGAGIMALTLLAEGAMALVLRSFRPSEKELESLAAPRFPGDTGEYPAPRIQADPADELAEMKAEELGRLKNYGWIDRKAGIAHIPVDRAIDILARKGLPTPEERGVKPGEKVDVNAAPAPKDKPAPAAGRETPK